MRGTLPEAVTVKQYLETAYSPDCDYVEGTLEERNVGEFDHAETQAALLEWFRQHDREWSIRALVELRIQVAPRRFRVADVCLLDRAQPIQQIVQHPPLVVIEVLSPEDRFSSYEERLADYRQMGVQNIWVVDPKLRKGYNCSTPDWIETTHFRVPNSPVEVELAGIFAGLESQK